MTAPSKHTPHPRPGCGWNRIGRVADSKRLRLVMIASPKESNSMTVWELGSYAKLCFASIALLVIAVIMQIIAHVNKTPKDFS